MAHELQIEVEAVPLDEFIPLPQNANQRHQLVGRFHELSVYIFDPYSIAISKLDRGFESDLQDVIFLLDKGLIEFAKLEQHVVDVLSRATTFDIDSNAIRTHLAEVCRLSG